MRSWNLSWWQATLTSMTPLCARTIMECTSYFVSHGNPSGTVFAYPRPKPATAPGIGIRTSTDRSAWTFAGLVWPNGASWTDQYTGTSNGQVTPYIEIINNTQLLIHRNLWAPACYYSNGVFLVSFLGKRSSVVLIRHQLYYAASSFGSQNVYFSVSFLHHGIEISLARSPQSSWRNQPPVFQVAMTNMSNFSLTSIGCRELVG